MKYKVIIILIIILLAFAGLYYLSERKMRKGLSNACLIEATEMKEGQKMNTPVEKVRKPAVAGSFYTGSKAELIDQIKSFLINVKEESVEGDILALVSPHAGYIYSGQVAAYGFKLIEGKRYDTVVILGPNHRVRGFSGTSVYTGDYFETPLGKAAIDKEFTTRLMSHDTTLVSDEVAHQYEHSLEVQIPFLQIVLSDFKIVPIVMGDYSSRTCEKLAGALVKTIEELKDKKVLILSSTDLSHGHQYDTAVSMDRLSIDDILKMNEEKMIKHNREGTAEMCGYGPVLTTVKTARALGYDKTKFLKYLNSMDVGGTEDWIVGYASIVLYKTEKPRNSSRREKKEVDEYDYSNKERKELLKIARTSMEEYVRHGKKTEFIPLSDKLKEKRGAFVTLNKRGQLRGCIGYIVAVKPLHETVAEMAINAAVNDSRFRPVTPDELDDIEIEISVLSPLRTIDDVNEITVGKHGIIIRKGFYSGLLLPQVATDYGWDRDTFLRHTCQKAGLPADAWKKGAEIQIFSAEVFGEEKE